MFKDYLLSLLEVDQFNIENNSAFRFWYNHIRDCANKKDGNILNLVFIGEVFNSRCFNFKGVKI